MSDKFIWMGWDMREVSSIHSLRLMANDRTTIDDF
jgi:hypothetical protein